MTKLHHNIRRLKEAAGLTGTEAARRTGISQGTWSDIECGRNRNPTPKTLEKIAAALDCTIADLWVDEDGESVTL